jgi:hypothetical protein
MTQNSHAYGTYTIEMHGRFWRRAMLSQDRTESRAKTPFATNDTAEPFLPMELLELELSLEGYGGGEDGFCEAVRAAAKKAGGEFLFDLPAAGLVEDCKRLAVLRVPGAEDDMRVVLAVLDNKGSEIRIQPTDDDTAHLARFADAFIEVLERI